MAKALKAVVDSARDHGTVFVRAWIAAAADQ